MAKGVRKLNGYIVIYMPEHNKAMQSDNWLGYVYEHIVVAQKAMGRDLTDKEEVHHLNGIRDDNNPENLLVLEASQHSKLHNWLRSNNIDLEGRDNFPRSKTYKTDRSCIICNELIKGHSRYYCSRVCQQKQTSTNRPRKETLEHLFDTGVPFTQMGKMYGVSDNAVRKWFEFYNMPTKRNQK